MTEFVKVIQEYNRLCESNNCDNCPLFLKLNHGHSCSDLFYNEPEKVEEIVMKWSRENPVPIYPRVEEVINTIAEMMGAPLHDFNNELFTRRRITEEVAKRFNIEPINKNKLN